jgi:DNA-binding beta-propeller fold protein YncE
LLFFAYHADGVLDLDGSTFAINQIYTADQTHNLSEIFAINSTTNNIYVPASSGPLPVVVAIDAMTNIATDIQVGSPTGGIVIDEESNQIYISGTSLTIIDGALKTTSSLTVDGGPIALNSTTHRVYVINQCGNQPNCSADNPAQGSVTVIQGGA